MKFIISFREDGHLAEYQKVSTEARLHYNIIFQYTRFPADSIGRLKVEFKLSDAFLADNVQLHITSQPFFSKKLL